MFGASGTNDAVVSQHVTIDADREAAFVSVAVAYTVLRQKRQERRVVTGQIQAPRLGNEVWNEPENLLVCNTQ